MTKPLYYLAHPVAPDNHHTYEENREDAKEWWTLLLRERVNVCAPWIGLCSVLNDSDPADRELGMAVDQSVLGRCDGLIFTGHTMSKGMRKEFQLGAEQGKRIINLIGLSFKEGMLLLSSFDRVTGAHARAK